MIIHLTNLLRKLELRNKVIPVEKQDPDYEGQRDQNILVLEESEKCLDHR